MIKGEATTNKAVWEIPYFMYKECYKKFLTTLIVTMSEYGLDGQFPL